MCAGSESDEDLYIWGIAAIASILPIRTIGSVAAVATRRRVVGIDGADAAGSTVDTVGSVEAIGAWTAGKICDEVVIVGDGNIEFSAEIRMGGKVMVTWAVFPSLMRGSPGNRTFPFWSAVTTDAVTVRSCHNTFPLP